MRACMLSCCSHVRLFVISGTIALQAPLSIGFSRQEYWRGLLCPPPGDLPNSGIKLAFLMSPALAGRIFFLPSAPPGKPLWYLVGIFIFTFGQYRYYPFDHTGWSMGGHDIQARMITDSGLSSLDWISNCFGLHLSLSICLQQGRDQKLLNMETEWVHSMERNRIKDREAVRDKEEREQEREGKTYNILWVPERIPPPRPHIIILRALIKSFFLS